MKERPILFSGDMVRAILDGRKTQTRRPVASARHPYGHLLGPEGVAREFLGQTEAVRCPLGQPGDRLWVRETWREGTLVGMHRGQERTIAIYRADGEIKMPWRPSIHMPRWASRITLEIVRVWVEQVQDITEDGARAEGIVDGGCLSCGDPEPCRCASPRPSRRDSFAGLWQSIYVTWDANPWVWAVEFRRVKP